MPDAPLSYENIVWNEKYIDCGSQALPYVALLIAMLFFVYAVIGMQVGLMFSLQFYSVKPNKAYK